MRVSPTRLDPRRTRLRSKAWQARCETVTQNVDTDESHIFTLRVFVR